MTTPPDRVRILIADDHTLLREALCDVLRAEPDFQIVAEAGDGESAVTMAASSRPDVALLDIEMPGNRPVETVRRLHDASPDTHVIILSMYADSALIQELLGQGIRGYLHKSVSRQDLASAIRAVCRDADRVVISVSREGAKRVNAPASGPLSAREQEVLTLVADAMSNRQIAGQLSITEGTVKRHLRNIFGKLGAVSRIDAVNKAVAASLIPAAAERRGYPNP
jgi:DNA-binding NarL/FixJ family response regulator